MKPERLRRYLEILEETGYGINGRNWDALDKLSDEELFDNVKVRECLQITEKNVKQPEERKKIPEDSKMGKYASIDDVILFHRLDEINGEFQDFHISGYKSSLLTKERDEIKAELRSRGYNL